MNISYLDTSIIIIYIAITLAIGLWVSSRATKNIQGYFLAGNKIPWWALGLSNASGMFDISGTMWMVYLLFIYGLKSIYIPWLWPSFNQIFLMVFLSIWLRRSGVMTGAEWIRFRFGDQKGATLAHLVVVAFALLLVIGFLAYSFIGIGKFAATFFPWALSDESRLNEIYYGVIFTAITTIYVVQGGMLSVVATEVLQFIIMTIACILVGIIAMAQVPAGTLTEIVPQGWMTPTFAWHLDIDWSSQLAAANTKIADDGYSMFSIFIMLALFKGILQSMAGPAPNFDMQRVLSAKTPTEAAKMSAIVNVVMLFPRYMLITGLVVLAIAFSMDELRAMGADVDFEQILPMVTREFIPSGLLGLLLAGLLAAFMSTFAATTNAAPAYLVNDVYKRYINPNASQGLYLKLSYVVSVIFVILGTTIGLFIPSLNQLIMWIVSALYGGYVAANVLKWYWWRFNGFGYFFGMLAGILAAIPMAWIEMSPLNAFPYLFLFCLFICVSVSLITKADDMEVLKRFYFKTRPWGFWRPVREALQNDGLDVKKNSDFARDASNVVVGLLWQTSLAALPIFLVIKQWPSFITAAVLVAITTLILKFNWYDNISDEPD